MKTNNIKKIIVICKSGFSLVEVLIALSIGTVIVASISYISNQFNLYVAKTELKGDLNLFSDFASSSVKENILSISSNNLLSDYKTNGSSTGLLSGGNFYNFNFIDPGALNLDSKQMGSMSGMNLFSLGTVTAKFYSVPRSDFFGENILKISKLKSDSGLYSGAFADDEVSLFNHEYIFRGGLSQNLQLEAGAEFEVGENIENTFSGNLTAHQGCNPFLPPKNIFKKLKANSIDGPVTVNNFSDYYFPIISIPNDQIIVSASYDSGGLRFGRVVGESIWVATQNTVSTGSHVYRYSIKRDENNSFAIKAELVQDIQFINKVTALAIEPRWGIIAVGLFSSKNQIVLFSDLLLPASGITPIINAQNENNNLVFNDYEIIATTSVKYSTDPTPEVRVLVFDFDGGLQKIKLSAGFTKWVGPEYIDFYVNNNLSQFGISSTTISRNKMYEVGSVVNDIYLPNFLNIQNNFSKDVYISTGAQDGVIKLLDTGQVYLEKVAGYSLGGWQTQENTKFFRDGTYLGVGRTVGGFNQVKNPELAFWNLYSTSTFSNFLTKVPNAEGVLKGELINTDNSLHLATTTDIASSVRDVISNNTEGAIILTAQSGSEIAFLDAFNGSLQKSSLRVPALASGAQNQNPDFGSDYLQGAAYDFIPASPLSLICDSVGVFLVTIYPPRVIYVNMLEIK